MAPPAIFKNQKIMISPQRLTDFDEIWHGDGQPIQESLANAKVNARQHCVVWSHSNAGNAIWQTTMFHVVAPKHAKSREIPREFDLRAVQGHPRSSILVPIESPYVTSY